VSGLAQQRIAGCCARLLPVYAQSFIATAQQLSGHVANKHTGLQTHRNEQTSLQTQSTNNNTSLTVTKAGKNHQ